MYSIFYLHLVNFYGIFTQKLCFFHFLCPHGKFILEKMAFKISKSFPFYPKINLPPLERDSPKKMGQFVMFVIRPVFYKGIIYCRFVGEFLYVI